MRSFANKAKINLGCGYDHRRGYLNVDVDPRVKPDLVHDLLKPLPFSDDSVAEIILQDVLEHFTKEQALLLLTYCSRVLQKGGSLTVRVPNVFSILKKYTNQPDLLMLFLYGDTTKNGTWGAHKYGYTTELLDQMIAPLNLKIMQSTDEDTNTTYTLKKVKLTLPKIKIHGRGWFPQLSTAELTQFNGKELHVCTDLQSYMLKTVSAKGIVIWCMSKKYSSVLGKLILRNLSRNVSKIVVKDKYVSEYVGKILKYSHLRTTISD